jgi:hypothetical protein
MRIRKWLMKQQWRVIQIRSIWSLFNGILVLAYAYFKYIPFFSEMGFFGPFAFSGVTLLVFLISGYIYDRVLMMWSPSQEVIVERNPYQYIPSPREQIFWFPIYSAMLNISEELAKKFNVETKTIEETRDYYFQLQQLKVEHKEDIDTALELRTKFVEKHQFSSALERDSSVD